MSRIVVETEREVPAAPLRAYELLADYRAGRPRILPEAIGGYEVEEGGEGAGTTFRYRMRAGRRERAYRMRVDEARAGESLHEADVDSSLTTTWSLHPIGDGERTAVRVTTSWEGAGGIGGFFERTFAPTALRRVYDQMLERLAGALAGGGAQPDAPSTRSGPSS